MTKADHQKRREILERERVCPKCNGTPFFSEGDEVGFRVVKEYSVGIEIEFHCGLCNGIGRVSFAKAMEYLLSR